MTKKKYSKDVYTKDKLSATLILLVEYIYHHKDCFSFYYLSFGY